MPRVNEKGKRFQFLIARLDEARKKDYYIEAMAITYALMEERTYSLLDKLGIPYRNKDKLFQCLTYLKNSIISKTLAIVPTKVSVDELTNYLQVELIDSNLIDDIQAWRNTRNDVIHDLAKTTIEYSALKTPCDNGSEYFRKYTACIMKVKKML